MAQFVVRLVDRTHTDPEVSARLAKRGDVIDVFPDGQLAMPQPTLHWAVVQVTGLSVERAKAMVEPDISYADPDVPTIVRRRLRCLDWSLIPANIRNRIVNDRAYTTTLATVLNFVRNKRTGALGDI